MKAYQNPQMSAYIKPNTCRVMVFALLLLTFFFGSNLYGQDESRITGRIQDAFTGSYMEGAEVTLEETGKTVLSNQYGDFRLIGVAAGDYTLTVKFTGFYESIQQVTVGAGETTEVETIKIRSRSSFDSADEVYDMATFDVIPEADAYSRALNVQRVSDYNKVVANSGAFGDVTEGNIGEFVKFLPGISINYVAADVRSIDVRGMGANFTSVTVDNNRMASAASTEPNRAFELEQVSINNVERIEVVRLPTPDLSADAIGGSVNLVSRSAFEQDGRVISYRAYLSMNSEALTFSKTPGWGANQKHKIYPGFDINYSDIFLDGKLGLNVSYLNSNQFNQQHRSRYRWEYEEFNDEPDDGSDPQALLRRYQFQDGPKFTHRESFSIKADYKLDEETILTGSFQWNNYENEFRNRNIQFDTNIDERSDGNDDTVISETEMLSKVGGGDIDYGSSWRDKFGETTHTDLKLVRTTDNWVFTVGGFYSFADNHYRDTERGLMKGAALDYDVPGQIGFKNFGNASGDLVRGAPELTVTGADGNPLPNLGIGDLSNFRLTEIDIQPEDGTDEFYGGTADFQYNFEINELPAFVKFGALAQKQNRFGDEQRFRTEYWGPDGEEKSGDEYIGGELVDEYYSGVDGYYVGDIQGVSIQWPDNTKIADIWLSHPEYFYEDGRAEANIISQANDIFWIDEQITSAYLMGSMQAFDGRLTLTGGARFEQTDVNANGAFFDSTLGEGIEDPIEKLRAQWLSKRKINNTSYSGVYPSIHAKIDITDKLLLRLGIGQTIGRPNFADIIPRTVITEPDEDEGGNNGAVEINNTALTPYESLNFDSSLEYYPEKGGQIAISAFHKDISDWISDDNTREVDQELIDKHGLPSDTLGYEFESKLNAGDATVQGVEVSFFRPLNFDSFPVWIHDFSVMANGTFLTTKGDWIQDGDEPVTELEDMVKNTVNFGITWDHNPLKVQLKYNKRGYELRSRLGGDLKRLEYNAPIEQIDLSIEYKINPRIRLFASGRNIKIAAQDRVQFSEDASLGVHTQERSEEFGVQWAIGIKGTL